MKVWKATSVSINKGSRVVTVTTGDPIDSITMNSWIQIGSSLPYEIKRGFLDGSTKKIELFEPWAGSNVSGQRAIAFPTRAEIEQFTQNVRDLIQSIETLENYSEFTRDSVVNLNDAASWRAALQVVGTSNTLSTGTGLSGGGNLSANRTISVDASTGVLGDDSGQVRSNFELDNRYLKKDDISDATLVLDFVNNDYRVLENGILTKKSFSDILTFSRSSSATMTTPNGLVEVAGGVPRASSFDLGTGENKGLLIEESRTNLVTYWDAQEAGLTSATHVSNLNDNVLGVLGGREVLASETWGGIVFSSFSAQIGDILTFKYITGLRDNIRTSSVRLMISGSASVYFTPSSGSYTFSTFGLDIELVTPPTILEIQPNVFEVIFTVKINEPLTMRPVISTGIAGSTIVGYGCQVEKGSYPTSYIPTSGSQVTRARDMVSIDDLTQWFNPNEGTIEIEFELAIDHETQPAGTSALFCLGPTGLTSYNKDSLNLLVSGTVAGRYILRYGTRSIFDLDNIFGEKGKALVSYDKDSARISINGGSVISIDRDVDTSTFTFLGLGNISGNFSLNGLINNFIYRPAVVSDIELQQLSAL